jgi:hypothetical protein
VSLEAKKKGFSMATKKTTRRLPASSNSINIAVDNAEEKEICDTPETDDVSQEINEEDEVEEDDSGSDGLSELEELENANKAKEREDLIQAAKKVLQNPDMNEKIKEAIATSSKMIEGSFDRIVTGKEDSPAIEHEEDTEQLPGVRWFSGTVDEMQVATVSKFIPDKGFGFLQLDQGTLYFHAKQHRPPTISIDKITLGKQDMPDISRLVEGTEILYVVGQHARGLFASAWTIKADVDKLKVEFVEQPMYKLVVKITRFSPLRANNLNKKFEQEILEEREENVWCGTDMLDARFHLRGAIRRFSVIPDTKFEFSYFILNEESDWVPCQNFTKEKK